MTHDGNVQRMIRRQDGPISTRIINTFCPWRVAMYQPSTRKADSPTNWVELELRYDDVTLQLQTGLVMFVGLDSAEERQW